LQTPEFFVAPDASAQGVGVWLHVLELAVHTIPVLVLHNLFDRYSLHGMTQPGVVS